MKYCEIFIIFVHSVKYCTTIRPVFPRFHHISPCFSCFTILYTLLYSTRASLQMNSETGPGLLVIATSSRNGDSASLTHGTRPGHSDRDSRCGGGGGGPGGTGPWPFASAGLAETRARNRPGSGWRGRGGSCMVWALLGSK